ncbi:uncharacterized protein LOC115887954 isoform X2 [Sitophilus oryzae]|uniref:Uncharacterized protein LOC115887954 isoform X2 n=1 Tax=Sitophilus oryzae TaxID=7048 RepID=A0A6J2YH81_SITOR|nr:uncharacterized protein LOC115887954 isoform X2 [Sitophilus oryzae]
MVNYVLSFCKITGASKIFTRNFYLPLLKPLTPREALRTLRITGKWLLGSKYQHYIPVLLNHRQKRSKRSKNYGKREHKAMDDFTYMTPNIDGESDAQKRLQSILDSKKAPGGTYVYTVEDKKYNIVVQSAFEQALRDGDIIDVLVSQKNDKILVKLKDFKKVPLELQYFEQNGEPLHCGEGATSADEEKFHHHGKYTMSLAKLFEDKETEDEKWEEELKRIMKRRKKHKWEGTKAFKEMMKQIMRKFDWDQFEQDAKKVIDDIEAPATESLIPMEVHDLEATKNVNKALEQQPHLLPTLKDIPEIVRGLGDATMTELETDGVDGKVTGAKVTLPSGKECFVSGQIVHTEEGDVFVPGQTIESEFGPEYAPGITINIDDKPTLVNGLIMGDQEKDPLFLPTQSTITSSGQLTFATAPEERPEPEPEEQRQKRRRKLLRIISVVPEEDSNIKDESLKEVIADIIKESGAHDMEDVEIIVQNEPNLLEDEDSDDISTDESSDNTELAKEFENLDIEAIRLKHEEQRKEMEQLKLILLDDGMNDLVNSLEEKQRLLKKKLEELRKISISNELNLVTYVNDEDAIEQARNITSTSELQVKNLAEALIALTRRTAAFRDRNNIRVENINMDVNIKPTDKDIKFNKCSEKLKILFKSALVAANDVYKNRPKDQVLALHSIVDMVGETLKNNPQLVEELNKLLNSPTDRLEVCDAVLKQLTQDISHTKVAMLKNLTSNNLTLPDCLKYLDKIIEDGTVMNTSFAKLLKLCPEIISDLTANVRLRTKSATSEEAALEAVQDSIVATVRSLMESNFEELLGKKESTVLEFVSEALSFAKALELDEVVENLSKPKTAINSLEESSVEMLKRMTIIRQLAEKDYSLKTAISRIKKNPECAKSDPRIRQLIRESAILVSEMYPVKTSRDIPLELLKRQNLLAIEDYLMRRMRLDVPVLVTRGQLQAVIPKEAARGVLAGRVPYILIDESGVNNFKPMHMLSNVAGLNKNREKRIENYLSGVRERSRSIDLDNGKEDSKTYLQAKSNYRRPSSYSQRVHKGCS